MASNPSGRGPSCNFGDYLVPRIADMPKFAGHVVSGADAATGIGEPGPPLQPLTVRLRKAGGEQHTPVLQGERCHDLQ